MLKRTLALTTLLVSLGSLAACGGEEETPESATDPAASGGKTETCDYPAAEEAAKEVSAPSGEAPAEGTSAVTIATSIGDLKAECYIPKVVDILIRDGKAEVEVLETSGSWFGVTYPEDKPVVVASIKKLVDAGEYAAPLWK